MVRQTQQHRKNADVHIRKISDPLTHGGHGMTRKILAPFDENEVESFFCGKVLLDEGLDAAEQLGVGKDHQLHFEDRRLFLSSVMRSSPLDLLKARLRFLDSIV